MNAKLDIWLTKHLPKFTAWYCKVRYGTVVTGNKVSLEPTLLDLTVYSDVEKYPPPDREEVLAYIAENKHHFPKRGDMRPQHYDVLGRVE